MAFDGINVEADRMTTFSLGGPSFCVLPKLAKTVVVDDARDYLCYDCECSGDYHPLTDDVIEIVHQFVAVESVVINRCELTDPAVCDRIVRAVLALPTVKRVELDRGTRFAVPLPPTVELLTASCIDCAVDSLLATPDRDNSRMVVQFNSLSNRVFCSTHKKRGWTIQQFAVRFAVKAVDVFMPYVTEWAWDWSGDLSGVRAAVFRDLCPGCSGYNCRDDLAHCVISTTKQVEQLYGTIDFFKYVALPLSLTQLPRETTVLLSPGRCPTSEFDTAASALCTAYKQTAGPPSLRILGLRGDPNGAVAALAKAFAFREVPVTIVWYPRRENEAP